MSEMSRVKKYENLRESINDDTAVNEVQSAVDELKRRNFENLNLEDDKKHSKKFSTSDDSVVIDETGDFKNEYLDSFIQEIKDYNIKKGVRDVEDTNLDILQQLSAKQRLKRAGYVTEEKEQLKTRKVETKNEFIDKENVDLQDDINDTRDVDLDIANEVKKLLSNESIENSEMTADISENELEKTKIVEKEEKNTVNNNEENKVVINKKDSNYEETNKKLIEETQQLKIQITEARSEINDLHEGIEQSNRKNNFINILIAVLLVILIILIIIIGGSFLFGGGTI